MQDENWDVLLDEFEKYENSRNTIEYDEFKKKYIALFNNVLFESLPEDQINEIYDEYTAKVNPYKPVNIVKTDDETGEVTKVLTLPPSQTRIPTLNECQRPTLSNVVANTLEQNYRDPMVKNHVVAISQVVDVVSDAVVSEAVGDKEYIKIIDDLVDKSVPVNGTEESKSPVVTGDVDFEWE